MDPTTLRCSICQVRDTAPVYPDATALLRHHPLARCTRCGLVFQSGPVSLEELDAAQALAYGEPERRFAGPVERLVRIARWSRVRMAARLLPPGGRVLDVGCGRGLFLGMLQERGYQVRGTELSPATAAQATRDVPIDTGELSPGRYPAASFDLISIWHVLEHLRRPDEVLAACHEALAPGGALVIAVPNFASVQARFGGPHWFHLDLPRHLFHFTPETLAQLLQQSGFQLERLATGQWEMDPFGLVQTGLNRLGLRPNGLYDTLRNHEEVRRDLGPAARLALLASLPLGLALAVPLSAGFRLAGVAGTVRVVARRSS